MKLKYVKTYQYITINGKNITSLSVNDKTYSKGLDLELVSLLGMPFIQVKHGDEKLMIGIPNVQSFQLEEDIQPLKKAKAS